MKAESLRFRCLFRYANILALLLFLLISHTVYVKAQKLPPILDTGSTDPSAFNADSLAKLKAAYEEKAASADEGNRELARLLRNRLIGIGIDQVDALFSGKLKSDRKKIRLVQFILDFLEIGAATAISLTKGERAKTAISEGLGALQASRTSLNKNFQLLERQVLINKMEANRATILASILGKLDRDVTQYPWEMASAELRTYRNAGTLDNALSSLSASVGKEKTDAEEKLREIKDKPLTKAATAADLEAARGAFDIEEKLEAELSDATKKAAALATLQKIVGKLAEDKEIAKLLEGKSISSTTAGGMEIINALDEIKENATIFNRRDLVQKINAVIIDIGTQR
jgi:hypothetical protein